MPDPYFVPGAVTAGILCGSAVVAAARHPQPITWRVPANPRFADLVRRAGWSETPERVMVLAIARCAILASIGLSTGLFFGPGAGVILGAGGVAVGVAWCACSLAA